jgi:DNA-binding NarL/FixJ family response regulator
MPIRVLLAQLPESLQRAVERATSARGDMTATAVRDHVEVLLATGSSEPDIVVLGMSDANLPGVVSHLADQFPHVKILIVDGDGRRTNVYKLISQFVHIGELTPDGLVDEMRNMFYTDVP